MENREFLTAFGAAIKRIRGEKNMTQTSLAHKCGFEKGNLSKIEGGLANPTMLTLKRISDALEVPMKEIFVNVGA